MNAFGMIFIWMSLTAFIDISKSRIIERYWNATEGSYVPQQYISLFQLKDGEKLSLGEEFCLKSIMVKAYLTKETFEGEINPSMRLNITWESDQSMLSINVESDSLNDSYCDANDRFSYHRKPIKNNTHTFPDLVSYGSRFIPIKLDCKYVVIPELNYPCSPLKLTYATPVCLSESVCSCRNISMPGPRLKVRERSSGVDIHWYVEKNTDSNIDDIKRVSLSLEIVQVPIPYHRDEFQSKEFTTDIWEDIPTRSGRHFFALNASYVGSYVVRGIYENGFGCSSNITQLLFNFPEINTGGNYIIFSSIFIFLLIVVLMLLISYFFRGNLNRLMWNKLLSTERSTMVDNNANFFVRPLTSVNNPIYNSNFQEKDTYLIDYNNLMLKRKLAEGHFGVVYLASWVGDANVTNVFAVKQLKETASKVDEDDFNEEIETFKKAGAHSHIVRMIGYCKPPQPVSILMEFVPYNLLEYLKNLRDEYDMRKSGKFAGKNLRNSYEMLPANYISANEVEKKPLNKKKVDELESVLDNQELESFALQIARGMAHLEAKNIVHRDLAARNVLIDNNKTLKISDFGLSRTGVYVNKTTRQFPLRWMSPEAVVYGSFSNKSDVWSYGIVLWEIGTLGGFPYSELQNDEAFSLIRKGGHPDKPEIVTPPLFNLMLNCWSYKPEDRPNFSEIVRKIENLRQKAYVNFDELKDYYAFPPTEEDVDGV